MEYRQVDEISHPVLFFLLRYMKKKNSVGMIIPKAVMIKLNTFIVSTPVLMPIAPKMIIINAAIPNCVKTFFYVLLALTDY